MKGWRERGQGFALCPERSKWIKYTVAEDSPGCKKVHGTGNVEIKMAGDSASLRHHKCSPGAAQATAPLPSIEAAVGGCRADDGPRSGGWEAAWVL